MGEIEVQSSRVAVFDDEPILHSIDDTEAPLIESDNNDRRFKTRCCSTAARGRWTLAGFWTMVVVIVVATIGLSATAGSIVHLKSYQLAPGDVVVHKVNVSINADNTATSEFALDLHSISRWHTIDVNQADCAILLKEKRDKQSSPLYVGFVNLKDIGRVGGGGLFHSGPSTFTKNIYTSLTQVQTDNLEAARQSVLAGQDNLHLRCSFNIGVDVWGFIPIKSWEVNWHGAVGHAVSKTVNPVIAGSHASVHQSKHHHFDLHDLHKKHVDIPLEIHLSVPLPASLTSFAISLPPVAFSAMPQLCTSKSNGNNHQSAETPSWIIDSQAYQFDLVAMNNDDHITLHPNLTVACDKQTSSAGEEKCKLNAMLYKLYEQVMQTDCSRVVVSPLVQPNLLTWLIAPDHEVLLTKAVQYASELEQLHLALNVTVDQHYQVAASATVLVNESSAIADLSYVNLDNPLNASSFAQGLVEWSLDSGFTAKAAYNASIDGFDIVGVALIDADTASNSLTLFVEQNHDGNVLLSSKVAGSFSTGSDDDNDDDNDGFFFLNAQGLTIWNGSNPFTVNFTSQIELLPQNSSFSFELTGDFNSESTGFVPLAASVVADLSAVDQGVVGATASYNGVDYFYLDIDWNTLDEDNTTVNAELTVHTSESSTVGAFLNFQLGDETLSLATGTKTNDDTFLFLGVNGDFFLVPGVIALDVSTFYQMPGDAALWDLTGDFDLVVQDNVFNMTLLVADSSDTVLFVTANGQMVTDEDFFQITAAAAVSWDALGVNYRLDVPFDLSASWADTFSYELYTAIQSNEETVLLVDSHGSAYSNFTEESTQQVYSESSTVGVDGYLRLQSFNFTWLTQFNYESDYFFFSSANLYEQLQSFDVSLSTGEPDIPVVLFQFNQNSEQNSTFYYNSNTDNSTDNSATTILLALSLGISDPFVVNGDINTGSSYSSVYSFQSSQLDSSYTESYLNSSFTSPLGDFVQSAFSSSTSTEYYAPLDDCGISDIREGVNVMNFAAEWTSNILPVTVLVTSQGVKNTKCENAVLQHLTDTDILAHFTTSFGDMHGTVTSTHTHSNQDDDLHIHQWDLICDTQWIGVNSTQPDATTQLSWSSVNSYDWPWTTFQLDSSFAANVSDIQIVIDLDILNDHLEDGHTFNSQLTWSAPGSNGAVNAYGNWIFTDANFTLSAGGGVYYPTTNDALLSVSLDVANGLWTAGGQLNLTEFFDESLLFEANADGTYNFEFTANQTLIVITAEVTIDATANTSSLFFWHGAANLSVTLEEGSIETLLSVLTSDVNLQISVIVNMQEFDWDAGLGEFKVGANLQLEWLGYSPFLLQVQPIITVQAASPTFVATLDYSLSNDYSSYNIAANATANADWAARQLSANCNVLTDQLTVNFQADDSLLLTIFMGPVNDTTGFDTTTSFLLAMTSEYSDPIAVSGQLLVDFDPADNSFSATFTTVNNDETIIKLGILGTSQQQGSSNEIVAEFDLALREFSLSGKGLLDFDTAASNFTTTVTVSTSEGGNGSVQLSGSFDDQVLLQTSWLIDSDSGSASFAIADSTISASLVITTAESTIVDFSGTVGWVIGNGFAVTSWGSLLVDDGETHTAALTLGYEEDERLLYASLIITDFLQANGTFDFDTASDGVSLNGRLNFNWLDDSESNVYNGEFDLNVNTTTNSFLLNVLVAQNGALTFDLTLETIWSFSSNNTSIQGSANISSSNAAHPISSSYFAQVFIGDDTFSVEFVGDINNGPNQHVLKAGVAGNWLENQDDGTLTVTGSGSTVWSSANAPEIDTSFQGSLTIGDDGLSFNGALSFQDDDEAAWSWSTDLEVSVGSGFNLFYNLNGTENGESLLFLWYSNTAAVVNGSFDLTSTLHFLSSFGDDGPLLLDNIVHLVLSTSGWNVEIATDWQFNDYDPLGFFNLESVANWTRESTEYWNTLTFNSDSSLNTCFGATWTFNIALSSDTEYEETDISIFVLLQNNITEVLSASATISTEDHVQWLYGTGELSCYDFSAAGRLNWDWEPFESFTISASAVASSTNEGPLFELNSKAELNWEFSNDAPYYQLLSTDGGVVYFVALPYSRFEMSGAAGFDLQADFEPDYSYHQIDLSLTASIATSPAYDGPNFVFDTKGSLDIIEREGISLIVGTSILTEYDIISMDINADSHLDLSEESSLNLVFSLKDNGEQLVAVAGSVVLNLDNGLRATAVASFVENDYPYVGDAFLNFQPDFGVYQAGINALESAQACSVFVFSSSGAWSGVSGFSLETSSNVMVASSCYDDEPDTATVFFRTSVDRPAQIFSLTFDSRVNNDDLLTVTGFGFLSNDQPGYMISGAGSFIWRGFDQYDFFSFEAGAEMLFQTATMTVNFMQRWAVPDNNEEFLGQFTGEWARIEQSNGNDGFSITGVLLSTVSGANFDSQSLDGNFNLRLIDTDGLSLLSSLSWTGVEFFSSSTTATWDVDSGVASLTSITTLTEPACDYDCDTWFTGRTSGQLLVSDGVVSSVLTTSITAFDSTDTIALSVNGNYGFDIFSFDGTGSFTFHNVDSDGDVYSLTLSATGSVNVLHNSFSANVNGKYDGTTYLISSAQATWSDNDDDDEQQFQIQGSAALSWLDDFSVDGMLSFIIDSLNDQYSLVSTGSYLGQKYLTVSSRGSWLLGVDSSDFEFASSSSLQWSGDEPWLLQANTSGILDSTDNLFALALSTGFFENGIDHALHSGISLSGGDNWQGPYLAALQLSWNGPDHAFSSAANFNVTVDSSTNSFTLVASTTLNQLYSVSIAGHGQAQFDDGANINGFGSLSWAGSEDSNPFQTSGSFLVDVDTDAQTYSLGSSGAFNDEGFQASVNGNWLNNQGFSSQSTGSFDWNADDSFTVGGTLSTAFNDQTNTFTLSSTGQWNGAQYLSLNGQGSFSGETGVLFKSSGNVNWSGESPTTASAVAFINIDTAESSYDVESQIAIKLLD